MTHTVQQKQKLLARVRRIRRRIEAIEHLLESDANCETVMQQLARVRGAVMSLMAEVVEDHVQTHLVDQKHFPKQVASQVIDVVRSYLK